MDKLKRAMIILSSLFFLPSVNALDLTDAVRPIANLGQFLNGLLNNTASKFLLVFIFMFILFYSIYDVALKLVKVFNGQDKQRKMVAGTLSVLSVMSLYLLAGSPQEFVQRMLAVMGPFGAIVLGLVMFLMVYFAFKDNQHFKSAAIALIAAGLALIVAGTMTGSDSTTSWGFFMLVFGLIWLLIDLLGKGGGPDGNKDPNKKPEGSKRPIEEDMGPGKKKYHKPNRVPEIHLCTEPEGVNKEKSTARVRVSFNIPDEIMASERVDNISIRIRPGKWYNIFAPGVISESKNIFKKTGPRMFPKEFSMRMFRHEYSADRNPYVIPIDIPQGLQIAVSARLHNTAGWGPKSSEARIIVGQNICGTSPKPKPVPPEPISPKPSPEERKIYIQKPVTFRFEKKSGEREVSIKGQNLDLIKVYYIHKKIIKGITCNLRFIDLKQTKDEIKFRIDTEKNVLGEEIEEGLYNLYYNNGSEIEDLIEILPSQSKHGEDSSVEAVVDEEKVPEGDSVEVRKDIEILPKGIEFSKSRSKGAVYIKNNKNEDLHWELNTETNPRVEVWIRSTKSGDKHIDFYRGSLKENEDIFIRPFVKKIKDYNLKINENMRIPVIIKLYRNRLDEKTKIKNIREIKTHYTFNLWSQIRRTINNKEEIAILEEAIKYHDGEKMIDPTVSHLVEISEDFNELSKTMKDSVYLTISQKLKELIGK